MQTADSISVNTVLGMAIDILERYAAEGSGAPNSSRHDAGPMVLALSASSVGDLPSDLGRRVVERWLADVPEQIHALGSFGGFGGLFAGVRALKSLVPDEGSPVSELLIGQVRRVLATMDWRTSWVTWADYDLFRGPAGLVMAADVNDGSADVIEPAARHLAQLCAGPNLEPLRAGEEIDPRSAFNIGRINTGMGHGVTGVAAALRHAAETYENRQDYLSALRHASEWLMEEAYLASDDLITWPPVGRDGSRPSHASDHLQAWCYGTPGVAWTLWESGRVLDDPALQLLGMEAMRSFCLKFDPNSHFDFQVGGEKLAFCHGAAGILAVADAFARHASLREADQVRERLMAHLLDQTDQISDVATKDMSVLNGAGGAVSVMLAAVGGTRSWLNLVALR